jgi:CheY-like chemotaxis protein
MLRILVVDDEKPIRQLLSRWLAAWGTKFEKPATRRTRWPC